MKTQSSSGPRRLILSVVLLAAAWSLALALGLSQSCGLSGGEEETRIYACSRSWVRGMSALALGVLAPAGIYRWLKRGS